jgi:hypothetical protein
MADNTDTTQSMSDSARSQGWNRPGSAREDGLYVDLAKAVDGRRWSEVGWNAGQSHLGHSLRILELANDFEPIHTP